MVIDKFIGQQKIITNFKIYSKLAIEKGKQLDHVIIYGNPGQGKTMLAKIIGELMNQEVIILNASNIKTKNDLLAVISSLDNQILFLDEIHQLNTIVTEELYSILQDNQMHILIGEGMNKKSYSLDVDPFTLIGATTKPEKILKPFMDRMPIQIQLQPYTSNELRQLIVINLDVNIDNESADLLIVASQSIPRLIKNICKRLNDLIEFYKYSEIDKKKLIRLFSHLNIDENGYQIDVIETLNMFENQFCCEYVGEATILNMININRKRYLSEIEPFLIKEKLITKTKLGRRITSRGIKIIENKKK